MKTQSPRQGWWEELPLKMATALMYGFTVAVTVVVLLGILGKLPSLPS